jgi:hypothetical protein
MTGRLRLCRDGGYGSLAKSHSLEVKKSALERFLFLSLQAFAICGLECRALILYMDKRSAPRKSRLPSLTPSPLSRSYVVLAWK